MTASNKVDLIVKDDGSTEVLIAPSRKVVFKQHRKRICLLLLATFVVLFITGFLVFFFLHKQFVSKDEYNFKMSVGGHTTRGTIKFNRDDNTIFRKCGNADRYFLSSISYGMTEVTAVIVDEEDGKHCLIRDDRTYGYSAPPVFPRREIMDVLMNETNLNDVPVVMDDVVWEENRKLPVKPSSLPLPIQMQCDGLPIFELTPWKLESEPGPQYKNLEVDDDKEEYVAEDLIDVDYDETKDEYTDRKKRQTEDDDDEEEEEDERPDSRAGDLENQWRPSDHGLGCCNNCMEPYQSCNRVCIPSRTNNYPYFYRNCNHIQCQIYFPCHYWRARG